LAGHTESRNYTYYDDSYIYMILKFPITAYPIYQLIKVVTGIVTRLIEYPYNRNIFMILEINYYMIAIDKENHYLLENNNLTSCVQEEMIYI